MKSYEPQIKNAFGEELAKLRRVKNLTLEKVAVLTKIQIRYLERLEKGEFVKLPADVYVRGMLAKYAKVIDADPEELWQYFDRERKKTGESNTVSLKTPRRSGFFDRLPQNRFINASMFVLTPKLVTLTSLVLILIFISGYFIYQLDYLVGPPALVVSEPSADMVTVQKKIKLSGRIEVGAILMINGRQANLDDSGRFEQDFEVQAGVNTIDFLAKNHLGKIALIRRTVIFEDKSATSSPTINSSAPSTY
jgi:transcriptional regulator with XRE-family HTH domain